MAGSYPIKTGLHAWKYAKGLYLISLLMVVHPEIVLGGPALLVIGKGVMAMVALAAFAAALEGHALRPLAGSGRLLLFVAAASAFHPSFLVGGLGAMVAVGYLLSELRSTKVVGVALGSALVPFGDSPAPGARLTASHSGRNVMKTSPLYSRRGGCMSFRQRCSPVPVVVVLVLLVPGCSGPSEARTLEQLASSSLAQIEGELEISGLREPVEVIRDEWGIPHIYAQNDDDLFRAQGYIMAQDRLWQMEMWRRWHEGRLAEIFGPEAFEYDLRTRLTMFRGPWDASEWTSYHPDAERIFTAYAEGVNAYIEQNRENLPIEFQLTGVEPDPWTAQTVVLRWAALGVPSVRGHALHEMQLAINVARFGAEEANRRAAPDPWDDLQISEGLDVSIITEDILEAMRAGDGDPFVQGRLPDLEVVGPYQELLPQVRVAQISGQEIPDEGSNNWVMSGARSSTGVPILANDPHRRIEMPALRYFVHLNAPGWNVMGGGEPPFVGVDAGHNERMAWGFTFAGTDMVDVYVEEVHPEDPNLVRYQNGWEPLSVIEEEIRIKGEAPRTVELKFSRHGPVFYEDSENGRAYALRSVVQEPGTAAYKGSFKLAQADSCADFFDRAMYLEDSHTQPHLWGRGWQHRPPGDRTHAGPGRMERAATGPRDGRV